MYQSFEDEFISRFSRLSKQINLDETSGRIWGILLVKNRPMTQKEVAEESGYSLSLVSPTLRNLEAYGLVSIVGRNGKSKLYASASSFTDSLEKALRDFMDRDVKPLIDLLSSSIENVKENEVRQRFSRLVKEYEETRHFLNIFLKILSSRRSLSIEGIKERISRKAQPSRGD